MDSEAIQGVLRQVVGPDVRIKVSGHNVWTCCPLAPWTHEKGSDSTPSCSVKIATNDVSVFFCWGCKEHGNFYDLLFRVNMLRGDGKLNELLRRVAENDVPDLEGDLFEAMGRYKKGGHIIGKNRIVSVNTPPERIFDDSEMDPFRGGVPEYVIDRGITIDTCKAWELGYDRNSEIPRLVFPVRDFDSNLVGITGRRIDGIKDKKYHNYWGYQSERFFYGEHKPVSDTSVPIIIVEGMVDVLWLWQHGIGWPLGLIGGRLTHAGAIKLQALAGTRAIFTFCDGDKGGDDARVSIEESMAGKLPVFDLFPPKGEDPASTRPDTIRKILTMALVS